MIKEIGILRLAAFFGFFLIFSASILGYIFHIGNQTVHDQKTWVGHSYRVIAGVKDLSIQTEAMLTSQRGYLISGDPTSLDEYRGQKAAIGKGLETLRGLVADNAEQAARVVLLQRKIADLIARLERKISEYNVEKPKDQILDDIEDVSAMRASIHAVNNTVLASEYSLLDERMTILETEQRSLYSVMTIGGALVILLIFGFNTGLLYQISRKDMAERMLKDSEDRFMLASEGANDGIFDWDLQTDRVFYSRQFFAMLGISRNAFVGTSKDFRRLIHPEDESKVWQYIESYLRHELSEYSNTYRMRHASGRWLWVNSRAKAIFGRDGRPLRMVGANSDITYMKEYQEKLKAEKRDAENANRAKSEFLAHMSHEIRTPLTAISGIAEIFMRLNNNLDEKQKQLVKALHTSTASLKDLISDILDFSKIESGDMELREERIVLRELFDEVGSIMSLQAAEKGLSFQLQDSDVADDAFAGDRVRLRQILINLIGNAVKFTEKGNVSLSARREALPAGGEVLKISISDTGVGIAEDHLELIFERFKQADDSVSRRRGGSGLGLSISRNLARLMGSDIHVESEVGKGSVFTLFVPWHAAADGDDAPDDGALDRQIHRRAVAAMDGGDRILLVEDYGGNIVVVSFILDELGCSYDVARNGVEALALWSQNHYDIVLMDVQMPEMDGFTATAEIRRIEAEKGLPRTPIIGMTAHALVGDKSRCIEVGMDSYLPKPIVETDFKVEILKYLNRKTKTDHQ